MSLSEICLKLNVLLPYFTLVFLVLGGISGGGSLSKSAGLALALSSCVKSRVPTLMGR